MNEFIPSHLNQFALGKFQSQNNHFEHLTFKLKWQLILGLLLSTNGVAKVMFSVISVRSQSLCLQGVGIPVQAKALPLDMFKLGPQCTGPEKGARP